MAELKRLNQNRASIKGRMTRINNAIGPQTLLSEAKVKATKIEELWQQFEDVQNQIEEIRIAAAENEDAKKTVQENSDAEQEVFEGIYFQAATKIQTMIDAAQAEAQASNRTSRGPGCRSTKSNRQCKPASKRSRKWRSTIGRQAPDVKIARIQRRV